MTWAVVPQKTFDHAKSRLAPVLAPPARRALARALFEHVLDVLARSPVRGSLVVTDGEDVAALAAARGARALIAPGPLGRAVDAALGSLGRTRALVVMADLPLLAPADVSVACTLLAAHDVVLVPDHRGAGTGALGLRRPGVLPSCFGHPDSFARHLGAARGLRVAVHHSPGLAFDLDEPEDLWAGPERLRAAG